MIKDIDILKKAFYDELNEEVFEIAITKVWKNNQKEIINLLLDHESFHKVIIIWMDLKFREVIKDVKTSFYKNLELDPFNAVSGKTKEKVWYDYQEILEETLHISDETSSSILIDWLDQYEDSKIISSKSFKKLPRSNG